MVRKLLFGETIFLSKFDKSDTYPKDISQMFDWMKQLNIPYNPTILDIGANIGMFSLSYASMFKEAQIHSFEPVPFIFDYLNQNIKDNPNLSNNIQTHNFGMSNCVERKQLSIPVPEQHDRYKKNIDIRLYSVYGEGKEKFDAQFIPLDKWINEFHITNLDFIKIDVEGYEYLVLEGASKTLRSFKPLVMFELNQMTLALSDKTIIDYIEFAKNHGYDVYGLEYGYKRKLLSIKNLGQVNLVSDLILFPSL